MKFDKKLDSERLSDLRKENGLTLKELSRNLENVKLSSLFGYENWGLQPDYDDLLELAAYFYSTCEYLLGDIDYKTSEELLATYYIEGKSPEDTFEAMDFFNNSNPEYFISLEMLKDYYTIMDRVKKNINR